MAAHHRPTGAVTTAAAANRVHGLVHVVAPGPVPVRAGGHIPAAGPVRALVHDPTPRALAAGHAVAAVLAPAPGTEFSWVESTSCEL